MQHPPASLHRSEPLPTPPWVIHGSDGAHALGNDIVLNIDELTLDWSTYCVDIALRAPGPYVSHRAYTGSNISKAGNPSCFGFLDPDQAVRGVHLIPAFAYDCT